MMVKTGGTVAVGSSDLLGHKSFIPQYSFIKPIAQISHRVLFVSRLHIQAEPSNRNKSAAPPLPVKAVTIAASQSNPPPIPQKAVKYGFGNDHNKILDKRFMLNVA